MKAFIRGTGVISPQHTFLESNFPETLIETNTNLFRCIEPSYSEYLNPIMARRMSRVIKMGIASALRCMKDANLEMPDAIVAGTALGCLGDTEKFLKAIIADDEQFLTPTSFVQSIQNSVSAQIALHLSCTGHNFTFAHKGFSFESAVLDALMLIDEKEVETVLVGGIDEMTDHNYFFYKKLGRWKTEQINSNSLYTSTTKGSIGGEGASFFVLSKKQTPGDYAELKGVKTIYNPANPGQIQNKLAELFAENNIKSSDIDLVLYGLNGDVRTDHWFTSVMENYLKNIPDGVFKHLCGEYQTASAFAVGLAARILKSGVVPDSILYGKLKPETVRNILIYNSYGNNHSLFLLSGLTGQE